jgi:hypothetical protein
LREARLDFFVLCSSLNAIAGGIGQVDYCAANAFLDAFAHAQAVQGQPNTLSINWDTWQQVGMAVGAQLPLEFQGWRADLIKQKGILPGEGEEVFRRLLSSGLPQALVSTEDLPRVLARYKALASTSLAEALKPALPARPQHPRPTLGTPYEPPRGETERQIVDLWEQLLGIAGIGIHDNFLELGGHSLLATQIVSRMRELFSLEFSLRSFFETPTIAGLAQTIAARPAGPHPADRPGTEAIPRRSQTIDQELAELERLSESEARTRLAKLTPQEPPDE